MVSAMTIFDYAVFTVLGLSVGLGWWRGFVYELLSIAGWIAAFIVARFFAQEASLWAPDWMGASETKMVVAYIGLFIGTLIICGIVAWLLSKLVRVAGLGLIDRLMGAIFGLVRGLALVLIMVLLAGLTPLPKKTFWRDAWSSQTWQSVAVFSKRFLPETLANKVNY